MQKVATISYTITLKTFKDFFSNFLSSELKNTKRIQIQIQIMERIFRDTFTATGRNNFVYKHTNSIQKVSSVTH